MDIPVTYLSLTYYCMMNDLLHGKNIKQRMCLLKEMQVFPAISIYTKIVKFSLTMHTDE